MQLTDETLRILHGHEVELRDHFIYLSHAEVMDPSANICAGIRWLFQKKRGAKARYAKIDPNHIVTWDDAVAEYKGVTHVNLKLFFIIIGISFPLIANALSSELKKKYPYTVLTDDYGILTGMDLDSHLDGVFPAKKFPDGRVFSLYWQCFPRKDIRISLRDIGYTSNNLDENDAELTIEAYTESATHQYGMRRDWPVSGNEENFDRYQKIMRGQKYICLEGAYFFHKDTVTDGKKRRIYYWTFEKMKTRKGCESYFVGGCHTSNSKCGNKIITN